MQCIQNRILSLELQYHYAPHVRMAFHHMLRKYRELPIFAEVKNRNILN